MKKKGVILRGIDFGVAWGASGALNFDGNGWDYHKFYKRISPEGFDFRGVTFVAKTTTLEARDGKSSGQGNMPLNENLQPMETIPNCIKVFPLLGAAVNAVGLTGPGAEALFKMGFWQRMTEPFVISFMSVAATPELRLAEFHKFLQIFLKYLPEFRAPVALTINLSCPNTKNAPKEIAHEALGMVKEAQVLNIPIGIKFGPEVDAGAILELDRSGLCDYVVLCNTLKVGNEAKNFSWRWAFGFKSFLWSLFGKVYSPLKKFGGGGYSGPKLRPVVIGLIKEVRAAGCDITIIACGGIQKPKHVREVAEAGANGMKFGTAAMLRFWRVRSIVDAAYEVF